MEFSRQEYWSALPFPSPGDLPDPGIEPRSSALQADNLSSEPPGKPMFQERSFFPRLGWDFQGPRGMFDILLLHSVNGSDAAQSL